MPESIVCDLIDGLQSTLCRVHVYLGFNLVENFFLITQQDTIHPVSVTACRATSTPMTAPRTEVLVVLHKVG